MITLQKIGSNYNRSVLSITGVSTDIKSIDNVEGVPITNGSDFLEIDTGNQYLFNSESKAWTLQSKSSGGGTDGLSAYEIATKNGFNGTESEWLTSLKGKDGAAGAKGSAGAKGEPGATGAQGTKGEQGLTGATGQQGTQGIRGIPGNPGIGVTAIVFTKDEAGLITGGTATLSDGSILPITVA